MSLTLQQKQAVISLSRGVPAKEVAEALRVSPRTLQRWRVQPGFKAEMQRIEAESGTVIATQVVENAKLDELATAASRAVALMNRAIDFMELTLDSSDSRVSDRLKIVQLLGKWNGFENDFDCALAGLRRYGLIIYQDRNSGKWSIVDQREEN